MTNLVRLAALNAARWQRMAIAPGVVHAVDQVAARLVAPAAKARYAAVSGRTGVPWWVIAVIHEREASQSWSGNLAQGDPWNHVSVHVPAGRGPFGSWEDAAIDALKNCAPRAAAWRDWSIGGTLTLLETYNGTGYANMGRPSPYVWAATDQYRSGKYTSDGHYDPNAVDKQIGCAALLRCMRNRDGSIVFADDTAEAPPVSKPAAPKPQPKPVSQPVRPAPSVWASIFNAIAAVFRRKS